MSETIKVRWLVDHEQTKVAPKTLSSQVINEDGTLFKDTVNESLDNLKDTVNESLNNLKDTVATKDYVEALYTKLNSNTVLGFYCIEDVTIVINGISKIYPANSNVEISFIEGDIFEIIPTSDNSILTLTAFPGALGTYYPWLEGVRQFSNILFDMNSEDMYTKWNQGNQGAYQVQFAQYVNCIFWSDNPYISDVSKRTNYTLCSSSQLPLCYSNIPDNTFKAFYLAFGVNSDPNWSNPAYKESFAKATWATQAFSYYGARIVGFPGHDSSSFVITLPKDCRGLMFDARNIECAGTFDAANVTNFGAKSGSWREAFGDCISLKRLYIKNLKVNLNISWSPIDYDSISYIISTAANTSKITISVSPYTYNLLSQEDFDLATGKNITIALLTDNYVEDKRLSAITNKADANHTHDDLYYTEVEIDTVLENINTLINNKADENHTHSDYATTSYVDANFALKSDVDNIDLSNYATTSDINNIQSVIDYIKDTKADWNQNDENAIDYIKNRTHYEINEDSEIVILDKSINLEKDPLTNAEIYIGSCEINTELVSGQTYTVVWDGAFYENLVCDEEHLGTDNFITGGDEYPFSIFYYEGEFRISSNIGGDHTVKIYTVSKTATIKQLDEKYIPDTIARKEYVDTNFALKSEIGDVDLSNYYTKEEVDNMEFITVDDIDTICGTNIQIASVKGVVF